MDHPLHRIRMSHAPIAIDLTDGSERGEYVPQDYILRTLGRPMRAVNLMYCYYPLDKTFPARARYAFADQTVSFQWDYPYGDYFPYTGGLNGSRSGEVFRQMQDIRRHGQDVMLTLTCDPHVTDEHLIAIAEDLKPYGRIMLRLNHEATGNWFSFNKRASYKEVADFFVHAGDVIRAHAPNVRTVICIGGAAHPDAEEMVREQEFAPTIPAADIWAVDQYIALHWGWPYDVALPDGHSHRRDSAAYTYALTKRSFRRFTELNGGTAKPMYLTEFNADGDVTGPYEQCSTVDAFFRLLKEDPEPWLSALNFYQFRDRGRLGLEIQDPNNADIGIEQPVMRTYKDIISKEWFKPSMTPGEEVQLPAKLRWGSSEDAEGIAVNLRFDAEPHFCELIFDDDSNIMIELNDRWFYKSPEAKVIDLMPAFYDKPLGGAGELTMKIFAPPATGENDLSAEDGMFNYYYTLEKMPEIRIRTAPTEPSKDR